MNDAIATILIPAFNSSHTISRTLDSIFRQHSKYKFNVLVVNDGSTDNTLEIINEYANAHQEMIVLSKEHSGITDSLNEGLDYITNHLKSTYVMRLDADDTMMNNRINTQLDFMEASPQYDVTFGTCIDAETGHLYYGYVGDVTFQLLCFGNYLVHPAMCCRLDAINKAKIRYNNNYHHCEDYWFYVECIMKGLHLYNMKNILVRYSVNGYLKKGDYYEDQHKSVDYLYTFINDFNKIK